MRLVDADAFKAEGRELYRQAGWDLRDVHYSQMDVECNIDMMPTIEAEPIKHGRWEVVYFDNIPTLAYCSRCDQTLRFTRENEKTPNYCPNCGAKMDGEENDN